MNKKLEKIENLFYDPEIGFSNVNTFHKKLKEYAIHIPLNQLKEWYDSQEINQIFKKPKPVYQKISARSNNIGYLQCDLLDLGKLKVFNDSPYLFTCIDIYSRYGWIFPVKNKSPKSIVRCIEHVINDIKKKDKYAQIMVWCDDGNEFKGEFKKYVETYGNLIVVFPDSITQKHTLSMVERFNQTIWNMLKKYTIYNNDFDISILIEKINENYNNRQHSSILCTPYEAFYGIKSPADAFIHTDNKPKYQVGDNVRIALKHNTFAKKSFMPKWSQKIHSIKEIKNNTYILDNGKEYPQNNLVKVAKPDYNSNDNVLHKLYDLDNKIIEKDKQDKTFEPPIFNTNVKSNYNLRPRKKKLD